MHYNFGSFNNKNVLNYQWACEKLNFKYSDSVGISFKFTNRYIWRQNVELQSARSWRVERVNETGR